MADMPEWAEQACDAIDAGMFSGDTFRSREAIEGIEYYMDRWRSQLAHFKAALKEQERANVGETDKLIASQPRPPECPTPQDGCTCMCHRIPGFMHIMPCC